MNQIKQKSSALLIILIVMTVLLQAQEQDQKGAQPTGQQERDFYTCEMHPEVKSDKPGKCPKCDMNLILASELQKKQKAAGKTSDSLSGKEKALKAKQLLAEAKGELYYNCCIKEPCDRCALDHQSCSCSRDLREGKGICSDCYAGWQAGLGKDIKGFTKDNVKPNFHSHKH